MLLLRWYAGVARKFSKSGPGIPRALESFGASSCALWTGQSRYRRPPGGGTLGLTSLTLTQDDRSAIVTPACAMESACPHDLRSMHRGECDWAAVLCRVW